MKIQISINNINKIDKMRNILKRLLTSNNILFNIVQAAFCNVFISPLCFRNFNLEQQLQFSKELWL